VPLWNKNSENGPEWTQEMWETEIPLQNNTTNVAAKEHYQVSIRFMVYRDWGENKATNKMEFILSVIVSDWERFYKCSELQDTLYWPTYRMNISLYQKKEVGSV
jgi:hypothetical protein